MVAEKRFLEGKLKDKLTWPTPILKLFLTFSDLFGINFQIYKI